MRKQCDTGNVCAGRPGDKFVSVPTGILSCMLEIYHIQGGSSDRWHGSHSGGLFWVDQLISRAMRFASLSSGKKPDGCSILPAVSPPQNCCAHPAPPGPLGSSKTCTPTDIGAGGPSNFLFSSFVCVNQPPAPLPLCSASPNSSHSFASPAAKANARWRLIFLIYGSPLHPANPPVTHNAVHAAL